VAAQPALQADCAPLASLAPRSGLSAYRYADASRPRNGAAAPPLVMLPLAPLASA